MEVESRVVWLYALVLRLESVFGWLGCALGSSSGLIELVVYFLELVLAWRLLGLVVL